MLTRKQKLKYLDEHGAFCAYCGDPDIYTSDSDVDHGVCIHMMKCAACNETWEDVYNLVDIND